MFKVTLLALLRLARNWYWEFTFALCGISVVEVRNGRPRLRLHNATDDLAELQTVATQERDDARRRSGALEPQERRPARLAGAPERPCGLAPTAASRPSRSQPAA